MGAYVLFVSNTDLSAPSLLVELCVFSEELDEYVELAIPVGDRAIFRHLKVYVEDFDEAQAEFPLSQTLLSHDFHDIMVLRTNHFDEAVLKNPGLIDFGVLAVSKLTVNLSFSTISI
jgi:hypothetical protein